MQQIELTFTFHYFLDLHRPGFGHLVTDEVNRTATTVHNHEAVIDLRIRLDMTEYC